MHRSRGFTLTELMITVTILAILLGIGVPSFVDFIRDNRVSTEVNHLATALNFARSEAVRRGVPVSISACSVSPEGSPDSCEGGGVSFAQGWCVHVGDASQAPPDVCTAANQLRRNGPLRDVTVTPAVASVAYGRLGSAQIAGNNDVTMTIVPVDCTAGTLRARTVRIAPGGRVGVQRVVCP
jgi:type IV fimbrial biogenesis protein FimT